jgi:prepilin-type processing-associated H-X9-DG protein
VQAAREAARRMQCTNNLKQIGLAMLNYEATNGTFPPGGIGPVSNSGYGFSWWIRLLPYLEAEAMYDRLDWIGPGTGSWPASIGFFGYSPGSAAANVKNHDILFKWGPSCGFCPSSPMKAVWNPSGAGTYDFVYSSTYSGISGAVNDPSAYALGDIDGVSNGTISHGGMLYVNYKPKVANYKLGPVCVAMRDIGDGTSHTMIVGENSDWCYDSNGTPWDSRTDGGCGFQMGPMLPGSSQWFNLTTVAYRVGEKSANVPGSTYDPSMNSIYTYGVNGPIQSAHADGANVTFVDGSVQFLSESIQLSVLYNLANKNDGNNIPANAY